MSEDDPIPYKVTDHDTVNHPRHYTSHPSGVECIDVVEHMTFCQGNAIKYLWRAGQKGDAVEDMRKAAWYATREAERLERLRAAPCEVGPALDASGSVMASGSRTYKRPLGAHVATFTEDDGSTTEVNFSTRTVTKSPGQKAAKKGRAR